MPSKLSKILAQNLSKKQKPIPHKLTRSLATFCNFSNIYLVFLEDFVCLFLLSVIFDFSDESILYRTVATIASVRKLGRWCNAKNKNLPNNYYYETQDVTRVTVWVRIIISSASLVFHQVWNRYHTKAYAHARCAITVLQEIVRNRVASAAKKKTIPWLWMAWKAFTLPTSEKDQKTRLCKYYAQGASVR